MVRSIRNKLVRLLVLAAATTTTSVLLLPSPRSFVVAASDDNPIENEGGGSSRGRQQKLRGGGSGDSVGNDGDDVGSLHRLLQQLPSLPSNGSGNGNKGGNMPSVILKDPPLRGLEGVAVDPSNRQALESAAARALNRGLASPGGGGNNNAKAKYVPVRTSFGGSSSKNDGNDNDEAPPDAHIRFEPTVSSSSLDGQQQEEEYKVEGAAVSMHVAPNGTVVGLNGELLLLLSDGDGIPPAQRRLPPRRALETALDKLGLTASASNGGGDDVAIVNARWVGSPTIKAVRNDRTNALCWSWSQSYRYDTTNPATGLFMPHRDVVYAEVTTGYVRSLL